MNNAIQQSRIAFISLICVIAAWVLLWTLIGSGANSHLSSGWVQAWRLASLSLGPLAMLVAIAGLVFDRGKKGAQFALLLSGITTMSYFRWADDHKANV